MCPQCGTRHEDWDHGADGEEDAYVAVLQRCVGCQVIADKQAEVGDGEDMRGMKVALVPAAVHAALEAHRSLSQRHTDDEE